MGWVGKEGGGKEEEEEEGKEDEEKEKEEKEKEELQYGPKWKKTQKNSQSFTFPRVRE